MTSDPQSTPPTGSDPDRQRAAERSADAAGERRAPPLAGLLQPSRLQPAEVDLSTVLRAGIVVWLLVGAGWAILAALERVDANGVVICAVGAVLGGLGLLLERRRRRRGR